MSGHTECVRLLVEARANIEYKDGVRDLAHFFFVPTQFEAACVLRICVAL